MTESAEIIRERGAKRKPLPPVELLRECFDYNEATGSLKWKLRPLRHFANSNKHSIWNNRFAGKEAGHRRVDPKGAPTGITVGLRTGSAYTAHSLVFAIVGVEVPDDKIIDHKNTNPYDNRWNNLRLVDSIQSSCNRKKRNGGVNDYPKGVFPRNSKFQARIGIAGKRFHLGVFDTMEEAHKAYCEAAKRMHGEFARFE